MTNGKDSAFAKSAFYHPDGGIDIPQEGLTKREYFAAMAMQGILSAQAGTKEMVLMQATYYSKEYPDMSMFDAIANESVRQADALINALNKENE